MTPSWPLVTALADAVVLLAAGALLGWRTVVAAAVPAGFGQRDLP